MTQVVNIVHFGLEEERVFFFVFYLIKSSKFHFLENFGFFFFYFVGLCFFLKRIYYFRVDSYEKKSCSENEAI